MGTDYQRVKVASVIVTHRYMPMTSYHIILHRTRCIIYFSWHLLSKVSVSLMPLYYVIYITLVISLLYTLMTKYVL